MRFLAAAALIGAMGAAFGPADRASAQGAGPELAAAGGVIAADAAHRAAASGAVTLIDIRTPQEWAATGSPEGAERLNLQSPDFGEKLLAILRNPNAAPVALICATGGRTGYVMSQIRQLGLGERAFDVSEGMMGSTAGPGWIARGLPVAPRR